MSRNSLPTLKEAKKYASFIKRPENGQIVLVNTVAPMRTDNGIQIDSATQTKMQKEINKQGMLVTQNYDINSKILIF